MLSKLLSTINNRKDWVLLTHNNPDPDTIAGAFAFSNLLHQLGKRSKIYYSGVIGRAENKEMIKLLKIKLNHISNITLTNRMNIALFDSQPLNGNQPIPHSIIPKIVIDHHPFKKSTTKSQFYDVKDNVGSTSTIIAGYFNELKLEMKQDIATALYYGLKTDTNNFTRDCSSKDIEIFRFLNENTSFKIIGKIENPLLSKEYYKTMSIALQNIKILGKAAFSDLLKVPYPDLSAEIGDFFIKRKGINWVLVFSYYCDNLYFSIRTKSRQKIAGDLAVYLVKNLGSGGGHDHSAGGMINVKNFDSYIATKDILINRFINKLNLNKAGTGDLFTSDKDKN